jgi:uncharacterized repeat protein (TIGR03803 family)
VTIQGQDGNFYGTTPAGGLFGGGTAFRVATDGTVTTLHAFHDPDNGEGYSPRAALVQAT